MTTLLESPPATPALMPTYNRFPVTLVRGAGCRVWDDQGREYLDFVAGIATCSLGHAHPRLVQAMSDQIQQLHHVSNLYHIPLQAELAAFLTRHSGADRVFFANSGAEANEGAIKLARKYAHTVKGYEQPVIITAQASFHGRTLATLTATGQPKYQKHFDPLVPGFVYVPYNDLTALTKTVLELEQVAAILLEPIQGEGGVRPGEWDYFQGVRRLCDERGILLILDEVQSGMGRTGRWWGYERLGIEPDIFSSAKGLGGGIPIGAVLCKEQYSLFQPGDHASTYGGNPLACRAALTVGQAILELDLLSQVQQRGEQLHQGLNEWVTAHPDWFQEVRGWGLLQGLVLRPSAPFQAGDIVQRAIAKGLLLVPAGPQVIRFVPPLIVTEGEVNLALERLGDALKQ
ncbi:acetylornithine aminotransferase [Gloeomargarita lithophora Alchichica-D10]|uniref:Acetylornithine aminotransferase n=1 Tax=Gloeomargarita lithophora Alchichica-D10 TaxID=1188229 RepID=A0A1J0AG78_9CYAN|nr:aspartate aminotransferase family protein [Gloeomargarita lithophora]APB34925.1 acetylornithine aminotransferase [Gloeomargarita lithophora Alchichica-D10]